MNNLKSKVIADSINIFGNRITTMELTYPRIIHSEFMTHRLFSRNASSSRAVPVEKMIKAVKTNMFKPLAIQKSHKGMQGSEYLEGSELEEAQELWIESAKLAISQAEKMKLKGISKQIINRILEPYQYYKVLVTFTEINNFLELRCPQYEIFNKENKLVRFKSVKEAKMNCGNPDQDDNFWRLANKGQSEIHMMALAEAMYDALNESTPKLLKSGEYHIPYSDNINDEELSNFLIESGFDLSMTEAKIRIAVARCARLSYQTLGDNPVIDYKKDLQLYDTLANSGHFSPLEHVARCMSEEEYETNIKGICYKHNVNYAGDYLKADSEKSKGWVNNFRGFTQYRYLIENK